MTGAVSQIAANAGLGRRQARLAVVQALYQMDVAGTDANAVIEEFGAHRFGAHAEDQTLAMADAEHFKTLVRGVLQHQLAIDPEIDRHLAVGWRLKRMDAIVRAILRSGVTELIERPSIPARVVISEYVEVAHAFFSGEEPKVVNAVLDKIARARRPNEFDVKGPSVILEPEPKERHRIPSKKGPA